MTTCAVSLLRHVHYASKKESTDNRTHPNSFRRVFCDAVKEALPAEEQLAANYRRRR